MPINREMDKEDGVHIYNEIWLILKANEMMTFATTWMDLEMTILGKSDQERQIPHDISCMWNLKKGYKWTYLQKQTQTLTDFENELTVPKGGMW